MTSCSIGMRDEPGRLRWRPLLSFVTGVPLLLLSMLTLVLFSATTLAGEAENSKETIIRGILADFQLEHFADPKLRGKTFDVVIKDFSPDDDETYVIIDKLREFYVISIADKRRSPVCGSACSNVFRLSKVRNDLVTLTRAKGLLRRFTVPKRKEDLPPPS